MQNESAFNELYKQLEPGYTLRVLEADSKFDIGRKLVNLRRRYPQHKISFAVIGGHGTKDSIKFGGNDEKHSLYVEDFIGKGRIREFFEENPSIVLISCSTGVEGGIGQELSQVMGANVLAPKTPTNIHTLRSEVKDSRISLKAEFQDRDSLQRFVAGASII